MIVELPPTLAVNESILEFVILASPPIVAEVILLLASLSITALPPIVAVRLPILESIIEASLPTVSLAVLLPFKLSISALPSIVATNSEFSTFLIVESPLITELNFPTFESVI